MSEVLYVQIETKINFRKGHAGAYKEAVQVHQMGAMRETQIRGRTNRVANFSIK